MPKEIMRVKWTSHHNSVIATFDHLLKSESLVDCTLAADGKYIRVHKVIVSASSTYLKKLLSMDSERHPIVFLNEASYENLQALVEFMYTGKVELTKIQMESFVRLAHSLQVKGLYNAAAKRQEETVNSVEGEEDERIETVETVERVEIEGGDDREGRKRRGESESEDAGEEKRRREETEHDHDLSGPSQEESTWVPDDPGPSTSTDIPGGSEEAEESDDRSSPDKVGEEGTHEGKAEPSEETGHGSCEKSENQTESSSTEVSRTSLPLADHIIAMDSIQLNECQFLKMFGLKRKETPMVQKQTNYMRTTRASLLSSHRSTMKLNSKVCGNLPEKKIIKAKPRSVSIMKKCLACNRVFRKERNFIKHSCIKKKEKAVEDDVKKSDESLQTDQLVLDSEIMYKCVHCKEVFKSKLLLEEHSVCHTRLGNRYKCMLCSKLFRKVQGLNSHRRKVHNIGKSDGVVLRKNKSNIQGKYMRKLFPCQLCKRLFHSLKALQIHRSKTHQGPFRGFHINTQCDSLQSHSYLLRGSGKPGKTEAKDCQYCGKTFQNLVALKIHCSKMHKSSMNSSPKITSPEQNEYLTLIGEKNSALIPCSDGEKLNEEINAGRCGVQKKLFHLLPHVLIKQSDTVNLESMKQSVHQLSATSATPENVTFEQEESEVECKQLENNDSSTCDSIIGNAEAANEIEVIEVGDSNINNEISVKERTFEEIRQIIMGDCDYGYRGCSSNEESSEMLESQLHKEGGASALEEDSHLPSKQLVSDTKKNSSASSFHSLKRNVLDRIMFSHKNSLEATMFSPSSLKSHSSISKENLRTVAEEIKSVVKEKTPSPHKQGLNSKVGSVKDSACRRLSEDSGQQKNAVSPSPNRPPPQPSLKIYSKTYKKSNIYPFRPNILRKNIEKNIIKNVNSLTEILKPKSSENKVLRETLSKHLGVGQSSIRAALHKKRLSKFPFRILTNKVYYQTKVESSSSEKVEDVPPVKKESCSRVKCQLMCEFCSEMLEDEESLGRHIKESHGKELPADPIAAEPSIFDDDDIIFDQIQLPHQEIVRVEVVTLDSDHESEEAGRSSEPPHTLAQKLHAYT